MCLSFSTQTIRKITRLNDKNFLAQPTLKDKDFDCPTPPHSKACTISGLYEGSSLFSDFFFLSVSCIWLTFEGQFVRFEEWCNAQRWQSIGWRWVSLRSTAHGPVARLANTRLHHTIERGSFILIVRLAIRNHGFEGCGEMHFFGIQ